MKRKGDQPDHRKDHQKAITALFGIFIDAMSLHETQTVIGTTKGKNHAAVVQSIAMARTR